MLRVCAVQMAATPLNVARNLETAERLVRQAAAAGAQLILLPELFNTGYIYHPRLKALAEETAGTTMGWLRALSDELRVHLAGSLLLRGAGRGPVHAALVLLEPSGPAHCHARRHVFAWEHFYFQPGQEWMAADTALGRIGLMAGWDMAHSEGWQAYAGNVDVLLLASAAPRLHRAVVNFPRGQKIYMAQLLPVLLRRRAELERLFAGGPAGDTAARAAWLGAPVVHASLAGRFVSALPLARLTFLAASLARPRYWRLASRAHRATLRASFYACSTIYDARGTTLSQVSGGEGLALADVEIPAGTGGNFRTPPPGFSAPWELRLLDAAARLLA
jgi:predicted amidohydrolase